ncbi:MAG: preprotein translocase subunit SecE [Candidatus Uhrbacteria bacterium]
MKVTAYIKECRLELGKVLWPSRKDVIRYSLLVLGVSGGIAIFLGAIDYIFTLGLEQLIRLR